MRRLFPGWERGLEALGKVWKCTETTFLSQGTASFNGFELDRTEAGMIRVHQLRYVHKLLSRYDPDPEGADAPTDGACPTEDEPDPVDETYRINLKAAQQAAGELLWLSTHATPDISRAVSLLGADIAHRPSRAVMRARQVRRYLQVTGHACLSYGPAKGDFGPEDMLRVPRTKQTVESFSDAPYAPTCAKSHGTFMIFWGGEVINRTGYRQSFITLSTAEAEMASLGDGAAAVHAIAPLLEEHKVAMYPNNAAVVTLTTLPGGTWRMRYLRIKSAWIREKEDMGWTVAHLLGRYLGAVVLTKHLPKERFLYLLGLIGLDPSDPGLKVVRVQGSGRQSLAVSPIEARGIVAACVVACCVPAKSHSVVELEPAWVSTVQWIGFLIALLLMGEGLKVAVRPMLGSYDTEAGTSAPTSATSSCFC